MAKVRNIFLVVVMVLVILGPASVCLVKAAGLQLPEAIDSETADYLAGNREEADPEGALSVEGFLGGRFQDFADTAVSNSIPAKTAALFVNAGLQRSAIQASNTLYSWPCYRTYFGSDYVFVPEHGAIVEEPYKDNGMSEGIASFAKEANEYAAKHPELDFEFYIVDRASTSSSNPASQLISRPFVTGSALEIMDRELTEDNVKASSYCYEDPDEFFADFYKSDHHWNIGGVDKAVELIADNFGEGTIGNPATGSGTGSTEDCEPGACENAPWMLLEKVVEAGSRTVQGPAFSGTCTRNGLLQIEDVPQDFAYDFSDMTIRSGDADSPASDHEVYNNASELNKHYQYYDLYYRGGQTFHGQGSENALLVRDSFGSAIQWPLGECFSTMWTSNNLHYYEKSEDRLRDLCDLPSCKKVIFVGCVLNYSCFLDRNPNAFVD